MNGEIALQTPRTSCLPDCYIAKHPENDTLLTSLVHYRLYMESKKVLWEIQICTQRWSWYRIICFYYTLSGSQPKRVRLTHFWASKMFVQPKWSSNTIEIHHFKTAFMCPRSIAAVLFDTVRFWVSLLLQITCNHS